MNAIDFKRFYAEVGKLLYAVADVDKVISQSEKKELHDLVRNELVPSEKNTDEFGTDAGYYTEMEFDILEDQVVDSEAAFQSFIDFIEEHQRLIDQPMRDACLRMAEKLAACYHRTNKKERELITTLKKKLKGK